MTRDRDVEAFAARAPIYENGWRGRLHHEIADRTADLALRSPSAPRRVLDVGCGTGYLLRRLSDRLPDAVELVGVDAATAMIAVATKMTGDRRVRFSTAVAERLPFADASFDLVVSTTSFDHWVDQGAGLGESARVLAPSGRLVLTDQFSAWLAPTLVAGRRGKARTKRRATVLVRAAGLREPEWHDVYAVIIRAVTATK